MTKIKEIVTNAMDSIIIGHTTHFNEVKYFHPNGNTMPNGCSYQRGGFIHECIINKESFVLDEGVHGKQSGMKQSRGGLVVFSTDVDTVKLNDHKLTDNIKQLITTFNTKRSEERIGAYSVGNFFKGKYVGENGEMYNDKSLSVDVNGISSRTLLSFAELLAKKFMQETVLVKDLSTNKIYLANSIPMLSDTGSNPISSP